MIPLHDGVWREYHFNQGGHYNAIPHTRWYLKASNNWAYTEHIKDIKCIWREEYNPTLDRTIQKNMWYKMDDAYIWTLGDHIDEDGNYGEIGYLRGHFFPPLLKLSHDPVEQEIISPEGWSVDLRGDEPVKIHHPKFFIYRTIKHFPTWGQWEDVWLTALVELDKTGAWRKHLYNYYFSANEGMVYFLQMSTENYGSGKLWVLDHLLEDEEPEPIPEPIEPPEPSPFPEKVTSPDSLMCFGNGLSVELDPDFHNHWLQKGVWQILKYGFKQAYTADRDRIILMNGSKSDGSPPSSNPEHIGGRSLDFRYPLLNGITETRPDSIDYDHLYDIFAGWAEIRDALYPRATIKVKMYKEYKELLINRYSWNIPDFRLVGDEDDPTSDRDHREHCHVNIKGAI